MLHYGYCSYLFEVCGRLHLPDWLHEGISHDDANVSAGVAVCLKGELPQVGVTQAVRRVAQVETEHLGPRRFFWEGDVDTLLKPGNPEIRLFLRIFSDNPLTALHKPLNDL